MVLKIIYYASQTVGKDTEVYTTIEYINSNNVKVLQDGIFVDEKFIGYHEINGNQEISVGEAYLMNDNGQTIERVK